MFLSNFEFVLDPLMFLEEYDVVTIIGSKLDAMINLILDNCFEIWRW